MQRKSTIKGVIDMENGNENKMIKLNNELYIEYEALIEQRQLISTTLANYKIDCRDGYIGCSNNGV